MAHTVPGLAEAERATFRQQWLPIARALVARPADQASGDQDASDQASGGDAGAAPAPDAAGSGSAGDLVGKLQEHQWVSQMANNSAQITWVNRFNSMAHFGGDAVHLSYDYRWR